MEKNKKKGMLLLLTIILGLGISLASVYFMYTYRDSRENRLASGLISVNYTDGETINITSSVPVIDDVGIENAPYEFSIKNKSKVPINANIKFDVLDTTTMKYGAVRYALYINDEFIKKDYVHKDNLTLYTYENMNPNKVLNCKLVFWVDYYYDEPGQVFSAKVKAEGESIDVIYKEATFLPGPEFNVKIKELAGTDTSTLENGYEVIDSNILEIRRASKLPNNFVATDDNILSTSDSQEPIYGWFDNGIIYYYTYAVNPYMNSSAGNMYRGLSKVESIDINTINTSNVSRVAYMFYGTYNLNTIDLSNFDTSSMISMASFFEGSGFESLDLSSFNTSSTNYMNFMFAYSNNLKSIKFGSNFNTSNVISMWSMFNDCNKIENLDISHFDMSGVTSTTNMFNRMNLLKELKTPKLIPNGISIDLPKTMYDSNGNAYTTFDSTSPTETWLKSEQNT